jgi:HD-GYP domain-containing protein (c-di-GMP phosphodiesterase class II)
VVDGRPWGAISVQSDQPEAFDEEDARLLRAVADQLGAALRSATLYEQLERAYLGTAEALSTALEAKDSYTASHSRSLVQRAEAVGRRLGMPEDGLRSLRYAAVFHDIGKLAVPEAILNKPEPLTEEERAIVERHTVVGEQILAPVEFLADVLPLVRGAHERWDGSGYPDGLAGEEIPLGARIVFACDTYDAMTTHRPYRAALPEAEARAELRRVAGTQLDPRVVDALLAVLG